MWTASSITQVFLCARCPFPSPRGWRLLAGPGVDLGEPGRGESVAAVNFRSSVRFWCPVLLRCPDTHVWWESGGNLTVGWEPSPCPPSPVLSISFNSALRTYSWCSSPIHGNLACLFPTLIPKPLHPVSPLPNAINLRDIANWNTFLQLQALVTVTAFSVSGHSFHRHLLSAGAQYVQALC